MTVEVNGKLRVRIWSPVYGNGSEMCFISTVLSIYCGDVSSVLVYQGVVVANKTSSQDSSENVT
jgi:hypothetical protein